MYIPLVLKLTMHSIRKLLIHITVFSVIHYIALDKLSSDICIIIPSALMSTTSFFSLLRCRGRTCQGRTCLGAHMPGARTVHPHHNLVGTTRRTFSASVYLGHSYPAAPLPALTLLPRWRTFFPRTSFPGTFFPTLQFLQGRFFLPREDVFTY
jgi:hypothetical protein